MSEVLVCVDQGQLKGKIETDYVGNTFYSFMAIPYAKAPLGNLRFKAPQSPEPWKDIRDATKEPPECYSRHVITLDIVGSEDCLYLNVYTPKLPDKENVAAFPVMFWIHGGAFLQGSSKREYSSPEFLMQHNVVLITINYRLGLLGFLSLNDPSLEVPGNAGLKDMVMALQWVQKNVAQFNGDPKNVTIFGESAGGAAVEYLTLSPLTKGLFHRAIMHSGSALCPWATGKTTVKKLSSALGVKTQNEADILKILTELSVKKLFKVQNDISTERGAQARPFGPVVEKPGTPGAFITDSPLNILTTGKYNQVPMLFLYNKYEGIVFDIYFSKLGLPAVHTTFNYYVPKSFQLKKTDKKFKDIKEEIKRFYYGNKEPSPETKEGFYNLETDFLFLHPLYVTIRTRLMTSNAPIYFCRFSLDAGLNYCKIANNAMHIRGACHVDELGYLFKTSITPTRLPPQSIEDISVRRFTKLWTNFAKHGSPILQKDTLVNVEWKPVQTEKLHYLDFDKELSTGVNPDHNRIMFWDNIYRKYGNQNHVAITFSKL